MNLVGKATVESKSTLLAAKHLQMSEQNHGFWLLPNILSSAAVTIPAPARSLVQEIILTITPCQVIRSFKQKKKAGKQVHCVSTTEGCFFS